MTPYEYCEHKLQNSNSNFLTGFKFMNENVRKAFVVLYAYCRELDDIVDDDKDPQIARAALDWRRQDLAKIYQNQTPEHPIHQALVDVVAQYQFPHSELEDIINGMEMDLVHDRYRTFDDLQYYCYRVAGVVGHLICRILGYQNEQTLQYADHLGLAMQLTNIIRDVAADAMRGRVYLPQEDLQKYGVNEADIFARKTSPEYEKMMNFQIERAKYHYQKAIELLPKEDKKRQKIGLVFGGIYHALLQEIEADGVGNNLRYKIKIPNPRKLRIAAKIWFFGFKP